MNLNQTKQTLFQGTSDYHSCVRYTKVSYYGNGNKFTDYDGMVAINSIITFAKLNNYYIESNLAYTIIHRRWWYPSGVFEN